MVYQPMLELLAYLRANGFKTFIVSGGGIEFMRPWTEKVYGIPPEQVVGSSGKTKFEMRDGKPVLMKLPEINFIDDKAGKPVGIKQHIGRRPIAAFGNSDGDLQMLQWTAAGSGPRFCLYVHHTDAEREWAYDRKSNFELSLGSQMKIVPVRIEPTPRIKGENDAPEKRQPDLLDNPTATLLDKFIVPRPSVGERMAAGKALRDKVPREKHGEFRLHPKRQDPVSIIEEQAKTRLPFLVPIRHSRMLASPFAFLRGSAAVMAADLAHTPTTGMTVQACGDMHVANFGVFASAERTLVFGINDFDETLPGPWEWDLKRLAASAVVCGRFLGGDRVLCEESARAVVKSYRKRMREYAEMSYLDVWYARIDEHDVLNAQPSPTWRKRAKQTMAKAKKRGHLQVLDKMAELVGNQQRIIEIRPFIVRETHTESGRPIEEALGMFLENYFRSLADDRKVILARYRIVDVARKVVGVGSVGTRCWVDPDAGE